MMQKLLFLAVLFSLLAIIPASTASSVQHHTIPLTTVPLPSEQAAQRHEFQLKHNAYYRQLHEKRQSAGLNARLRGQSASNALPHGRWSRVEPAADTSLDISNSTLAQQVIDYVQSLEMMTNVTLGTPGKPLKLSTVAFHDQIGVIGQKVLTLVEFLSTDFYFLDDGVVSAGSLFGSTEASTFGDRYCPA